MMIPLPNTVENGDDYVKQKKKLGLGLYKYTTVEITAEKCIFLPKLLYKSRRRIVCCHSKYLLWEQDTTGLQLGLFINFKPTRKTFLSCLYIQWVFM